MILIKFLPPLLLRSRAPQVVPFRDSKLTRVLQNFFTGLGRSVMVVNINPCASTYDETLQALKFSAIATQVLTHTVCLDSVNSYRAKSKQKAHSGFLMHKHTHSHCQSQINLI